MRIYQFKKNQSFNTNTGGAGFTLIEILLAMSIVLLIAGGSYIGFTSFNRQQVLTSSWDTLRNSFNEARSDAASQVIRTSVCNTTGQTLVGHQLNFYSANPSYYELVEICKNAAGTESPPQFIKIITLPPDISFNPANPPSIRFVVLTGGISGGSKTVTIANKQGKFRSITVNTVGVIQ